MQARGVGAAWRPPARRNRLDRVRAPGSGPRGCGGLMATLRIEGGRRLSGTVAVEGNKNSALPLIAACLLTEEECVISNVPRIRDVDVLLEIIQGLGASVQGRGTSTLRITCGSIASERPDPVLV